MGISRKRPKTEGISIEELIFGRVAKRTEHKRKTVIKFGDQSHLSVFSDGLKVYVPHESIHSPRRLRILVEKYLQRKGKQYARGGNSVLYKIEGERDAGTQHLLKVFMGGRSPFTEFRHMNELRRALKKHSNYHVPEIELVVDTGRNDVQGYMVIEFKKQLTVQQVIELYEKLAEKNPNMKRKLQALRSQYDLLKQRVTQDPALKEVVTDFHEGNVLVTHEPGHDKLFHFTLFDQ